MIRSLRRLSTRSPLPVSFSFCFSSRVSSAALIMNTSETANPTSTISTSLSPLSSLSNPPNSSPVPMSSRRVQYLTRPNLIAPGEQCTYHREAGFLHVSPYYFNYSSFSKSRWHGRTLIEILVKEFSVTAGIDPLEYFSGAIADGRVKVNGAAVKPDYRVVPHDLLVHSIHRHEPPVSDQPITVVFENSDFVAVSKPGSIPVHSCGKYYHLSVLGILASRGLGVLHCIHRLDRLTSGLLILARSSEIANSASRRIKRHAMEKVYLARVMGEFPPDSSQTPILVTAPIVCTSKQSSSHSVSSAGDGKSAVTKFRFLSFDGQTSLVECWPMTGKTHQIRIHLQHIGFPIANDPVYGGRLFESNSFKPTKKPDNEHFNVFDENCGECHTNVYYSGHEHHPSHLWLHAWKYSTLDEKGEIDTKSQYSFSITTPKPDWAEDGFDSAAALSRPIADSFLPTKRKYNSYAKLDAIGEEINARNKNNNWKSKKFVKLEENREEKKAETEADHEAEAEAGADQQINSESAKRINEEK